MHHSYSIDNKPIVLKNQHPYLEVIFHHWSHHIDHLYKIATKSINFKPKQMLQRRKDNSKSKTVYPLLEYASCVWDPHQQFNILEKVQQRAARWVTSEYNSMSSATNWKTLQSRRNVSPLSLLYKVLHHDLLSILPEWLLQIHRVSNQTPPSVQVHDTPHQNFCSSTKLFSSHHQAVE